MMHSDDTPRLIVMSSTPGDNPPQRQPKAITVDADVTAARHRERAALTRALMCCLTFMVVELFGGYISHSLAILTDALHLMTDVGAYALSIFALTAAGRAANERYNYGWHRAEVLGTLFSVFTIWALAGAISFEAISRIWNIIDCARLVHLSETSDASLVEDAVAHCVPIDSKVMVIVGILGMLVNISCACILYFGGSHGHSHGGGDHGHSHDGHSHDGHSHDGHSHDGHSHDGHSHDGHIHDGHSHDGHSEHGDDENIQSEVAADALRRVANVDDAQSHEAAAAGPCAGDEREPTPKLTLEQVAQIPPSDVIIAARVVKMDTESADHHHHHNIIGPSSSSAPSARDDRTPPKKKRSGFAIHAAFLHALGDCVQSFGVIAAGIFIYVANVARFGKPVTAHSYYNLADSFSSILFAIVTLKMTKNLIYDILAILMESTPTSVDYPKLAAALADIPGVLSVHDLHVWSIARDFTACSVHLVANNHMEVLHEAQKICEDDFHISHHTIQVDSEENGSERCGHRNGGGCMASPLRDLGTVQY
jgi:solute carrier family 30 (zinc transporter), member 2